MAFTPNPAPERTRRTQDLAISVTGIIWFVSSALVAARSARGLTNRFNTDSGRLLLSALFLIFLLAVGYSLLEAIARRSTSLGDLLGLPKRPTAGREWTLGVALGWGIAVVAVLPLVLTKALHVGFWTEPRAFLLIPVNLATIAAVTLAEEIAFRGYPFRRLVQATGPVAATIVMSGVYGLVHVIGNGTAFGFWPAFLLSGLAGMLLSLAWFRTHGLWLPWGIHFAFNASIGILFGLPVVGSVDYSTVIQATAYGPLSLTGGNFGPESALFTAIVLLIAIGVLYRITRDYAWHYTFAPITPGGYPMEAQPPAAHAAMERSVAPPPPPPLVQILPTTPQTRSVTDEPQG